MSAYVPPWKRKAQEAANSTSPAGPNNSRPRTLDESDGVLTYSFSELTGHLGGKRMDTINLFSYVPPQAPRKSVKEMLQEEREKGKIQQESPSDFLTTASADLNPLAGSEDANKPHPHGHIISWIQIVPDAHPLFETENELWFHTNSQDVVDYPENLGRPIPFFGQPARTKGSDMSHPPTSANVTFLGYWTLKSYREVPPRSDELKELLTTKQERNNYGKQGRTAASWQKAMHERWVKAKVERYLPEAGEEDKWRDPLKVEFGTAGQEKGDAWLDFVLRDIASRRPKGADEANLTRSTAKMSIGGPAPNLPEPTVPVVPSEFKDDQEETPEAREQRMVHDVYETIAPHFSQTRYKPWPIIARFLSSIPPHSLGLDSGAGNGKYLPVVREGSHGSRMIALDRSSGLLSVAKSQKGEIGDEVVGGVEECVRGDLAFDGWRHGVFDFAISIAAVHHLSTRSRRVQSIRSLLAPLYLSSAAPFSKFIVYVWAYEQGENSKRKMGVLASPPEDDDSSMAGPPGQERKKDQDVLVPWVLQGPQEKKVKQPRPRKNKGKPGNVKPSGLEDGSTGEAGDTTTTTTTDDNDETVLRQDQDATPSDEPAMAIPEQAQPERQVFHRYYHLFVEGELREDVVAAAKGMDFAIREANEDEAGKERGSKWLRIIEEGYEKDNWYLEGEVGVY